VNDDLLFMDDLGLTTSPPAADAVRLSYDFADALVGEEVPAYEDPHSRDHRPP